MVPFRSNSNFILIIVLLLFYNSSGSSISKITEFKLIDDIFHFEDAFYCQHSKFTSIGSKYSLLNNNELMLCSTDTRYSILK